MNTKTWFVTGASKGLGLALVKKLLSEGYRVAATSRNKSALLKSVGAQNESFLPLEVNLSDESQIREAVRSAVEKFKTIDVLVNNAGYGQGGSAEEVSDVETRENFEVNVFGLLNVTRAILPVMRNQKAGHIFNISSVGGLTGAFSGWGVYCSTKFAVAGLTEALHEDVKDFGIHVTLVYPGYFRTQFLEEGSLKLPSKMIPEYASSKASMDLHKGSINRNQPGDPDKAADVLIQMTKEANPPLHLLLGSDALKLARAKVRSFTAEVETWKATSESTDF